MIATLSGTVLYKTIYRAVIDVGGVGYETIVTTDAIARMPEKNERVFLYIHTNVREDAITLYGFLEEEEKELFLILKTVSGIGPKLALSMLSGLRVPDICLAIGAGDFKRLTTLPGVGKKTAERICVDLKDKVSHLAHGGGGAGVPASLAVSAGSELADAVSALSNLGYPDSVAQSALAAVQKQVGDEVFAGLKVEDLIRLTLRSLA